MPSRRAHKPKRKKVKKHVLSPWWLLAVAGGFLAGILLPHLLTQDAAEDGAAVPSGYRRYMLDLSHHNPRHIQWDSLKVLVGADGNTTRSIARARSILPLTHVVMKATEGESFRDRHFSHWWAEAAEAGLSRGAYHFFRSSKDPLEQARNYIGRVQLSHRDLPPILDIETVHRGCTRAELNRRALIWLQEVEKYYGRKPWVYASDSFINDWLSEDISKNYPLWIARYNSEKPRTAGWVAWQFTDGAVVYGVSGKTDLSVLP